MYPLLSAGFLLAAMVMLGMTFPERPILMTPDLHVDAEPLIANPRGPWQTSPDAIPRITHYSDSLHPIERMEQPADVVFKNIRVLKGITARELIGSMEYMESALGVGCNYCHVQGNFASDEKPQKETARSMIHMVNDINQRTFSAPTVTCNTCHHGQPHPDAVPSIHQKEWMEIDRAALTDIAPDSGTTLSAVLERHLEALGGVAAVERIRTRTTKLLHTPVREQNQRDRTDVKATPLVCYQTSDGKYFSRMPLDERRGNNGAGELLRGYDRMLAWAKNGDRSPNRIFNEGLAIVVRSAELFPARRLLQDSRDVTLLGRAHVNDRDYYVVSATGRDNSSERIYFDVTTGLVTRRFVTVPTVLGQIPIGISYDDYRSVDGVRIPHTLRWSTPRENWTETVTELHHNVAIDDRMFVMPSR